jgi:hypothetical protein
MTATTTLTRQRLQQLAEEATALAEWTTVRDFALQMYGEGKAVKVEIETHGEYNDEGSTDYRINGITAYDKNGKELEFDHSLPFFATKGWNRHGDDNYNGDFQKLNDLWMDHEEKQRGGWILIGDLPVDEHEGDDETYDLTTIPSLSLPV